MVKKSSGTHLVLPSLGRLLSALDRLTNGIDGQLPGHAQRAGEGPTALREFETLPPGMHVCTTAGLSRRAVRNRVGSACDDSQQVGLSIPLTAADTGAQRYGASD
jgi:hypothetical protein